ncbi:MAG TPA: hypothetical protein VK665_10295 [Candidatus Elarobacter sp.]|nr:hypothetical protein [Candidatus Elarobacter sp.]
MATAVSGWSPVDTSTAERLAHEHRTEIEDAVETIERLRTRKARVNQQLAIVRSNLLRLRREETGWHGWLVWPIFLIGATLEWNIAQLVAQTVFGQSQLAMNVFAVALAVCGVTAGWFLGRVLRERRTAGPDPSASPMRFIVVTIVVVGLLLAAAFLLRIQAGLIAKSDGITVVGQALITTVLSALGILVAAGFEFFREGDEHIDAVKKRRLLERERDTVRHHLFHAEANFTRAIRSYGLVAAQIGVPVDEAFVVAMHERAEIALRTVSQAGATPASEIPPKAKKVDVVSGELIEPGAGESTARAERAERGGSGARTGQDESGTTAPS